MIAAGKEIRPLDSTNKDVIAAFKEDLAQLNFAKAMIDCAGETECVTQKQEPIVCENPSPTMIKSLKDNQSYKRLFLGTCVSGANWDTVYKDFIKQGGATGALAPNLGGAGSSEGAVAADKPDATKLETDAVALEKTAKEKKKEVTTLTSAQQKQFKEAGADQDKLKAAAEKYNEVKTKEKEAATAEAAAKEARAKADAAKGAGAPKPKEKGADVTVKASTEDSDALSAFRVGWSVPHGGLQLSGENSTGPTATTGVTNYGLVAELKTKYLGGMFGFGLRAMRTKNTTGAPLESSVADIYNPYLFLEKMWSKGDLDFGLRAQIGWAALLGPDYNNIMVDSTAFSNKKFDHITLGAGVLVSYKVTDDGIRLFGSYVRQLATNVLGDQGRFDIGSAFEPADPQGGGGDNPRKVTIPHSIIVGFEFPIGGKAKKDGTDSEGN